MSTVSKTAVTRQPAAGAAPSSSRPRGVPFARLTQLKAVVAGLDLNPAERTIGRAIRGHVSEAVSRAESAPQVFKKPDHVVQIFREQDFAPRVVHDLLHIDAHCFKICLCFWGDKLRSRFSRQRDDEYRYPVLPRRL